MDFHIQHLPHVNTLFIPTMTTLFLVVPLFVQPDYGLLQSGCSSTKGLVSVGKLRSLAAAQARLALGRAVHLGSGNFNFCKTNILKRSRVSNCLYLQVTQHGAIQHYTTQYNASPGVPPRHRTMKPLVSAGQSRLARETKGSYTLTIRVAIGNAWLCTVTSIFAIVRPRPQPPWIKNSILQFALYYPSGYEGWNLVFELVQAQGDSYDRYLLQPSTTTVQIANMDSPGRIQVILSAIGALFRAGHESTAPFSL